MRGVMAELLTATLWIVCCCLTTSVAQPVPFPAEEDLISMLLTNNDEVIAAGRSIIYRLSANLSQLDEVMIHRENVRGLSLTSGGQNIISCFSNGSCNAYNVTDFNNVLIGPTFSSSGITFESDPVAMFPGESESDVYIGVSHNSMARQQYPMVLSQYSVNGGTIVTDRTREYQLTEDLLSERIFHTGFVANNFAYYIVGDGGSSIRILRVCNQSTDQSLDDASTTGSQLFRALYEVKLVCGVNNNGPFAQAFAGAAVVRNFPNRGINTLVLTVRSPLLDLSNTSRVCTYSLSDINTAMDNSLTACAAGENRRVVWDESSLEHPCESRTVSFHY